MAETEELKQMVLSFRRAELVELLGFVGMNKVGVKATLLQRSMTLVNSARGCSLPVQIKIRELYSKENKKENKKKKNVSPAVTVLGIPDKNMVMNFRVSELQVLLGYAGWNKNGRKSELLQRACYHIDRGCSTRIHHKIRELCRQIHNPFASEPPRSRSGASVRAQQADQELRSRRYAPGKSSSLSGSTGLSGSSSINVGAVDFSKRSSADSLSTGGTTLPVHPDVTFKRLPFYDIMGELLKPTSLGTVPKGPARYQETYFIFHLTPQQAQDIAMSRDFRPSAKVEYTVQVQLRFCFLETSCEQDDNFPPSICVRVNGKVAQLPNPIPTTKPGVEPKRPGRPVDITSLCRISPTMPNHVEISWASEYGRCYCVSINLVKRLTSDVLLSRLKQFGNRHADHTRALIKDKLRQDPDCEIATTSLRVSLVCPLGKMRMLLPCRAATCTHLQCFDATTFLLMNEKKATWMCPVCDKPTPFHKLIIDGLFVEILRKVSDVDEIQFVEDGSWSPIRNCKETHNINSPNVSRTARGKNRNGPDQSQTVNLCGDSEPTSSPLKKPKMEVIDLTLSDSDDDDSDHGGDPPPRPQSSTEISSGIVADALIYGTPIANRVDPDETAPTGAVSPGSTLCASTSNQVTMRIVADTLIYGTPIANRVDPDETAPARAVSSGSNLFANASNHVTMRSSTPSLIINSSVVSPTSPVSAPAPVITTPTTLSLPECRVNLSLPPLPAVPPLYRAGTASSPSKTPASVSRSSSTSSNSGLNLSISTASNGYGPYSSSSPAMSFSPTETSPSSASTSSWLTALSGQNQGQKRPPPAHTNSAPPTKRHHLEKMSDSPSSSNSNMSPLVDLDQLCSILDSDRDRNSEEISSVLAFPSDFPMPMSTSMHSSSTASAPRTMFNSSPSDVISLD